MKTKTMITEINHEDLVELFSTALYGNNWLVADYDYKKYQHLFEENDCYEDKLANILLNGGTIELVDMNACDEDDGSYGFNQRVYYDKNRSAYIYPITYIDVVVGLQNTLDGDVICHCDEESWLKEAAMRYVTKSMEFDMVDADALMQSIMFNELVYG